MKFTYGDTAPLPIAARSAYAAPAGQPSHRQQGQLWRRAHPLAALAAELAKAA